MPASFDTLAHLRATEARRVARNAVDAARRAARVIVATEGKVRAEHAEIVKRAALTASEPAKTGTAFAVTREIRNGEKAAKFADRPEVTGALYRTDVCKVRSAAPAHGPVSGPPAPPTGTILAMAEAARGRALYDMHGACQLWARNTGAARKAGHSRIRAILHNWCEDPHTASELQKVCQSYGFRP